MKKALVPVLTTVLLITIAAVNPALGCRTINIPGKGTLKTSSCFTANGHVRPPNTSDRALDACIGSYPSRQEWESCLAKVDGRD